MGFSATVRIHKTRRTARHGDLSLCLDEVAGIGSFLEVETMKHNGSTGLAEQAKLAAFVAGLDIEVTRTE
jgi:adenylate cyclase class 2